MDIKQEIKKLLEKVVGKPAEVDRPADLAFGDYTTSIAIKEKLDAGEIAKKLEENSLFEKVEAVNGFINFFLKSEHLLGNLALILEQKEKYGSSDAGKGKTVVIDYSAPNIAKPFGVGHLRSTIIGQAIYNIYKSQGYTAIGDNHLGDWGTQFGKLIYQIELKIKNEKLKIKELDIEKLEKLYVEFHQQAKENPKLEDEARAWFKKLEDGNKEAKAIWQACYDISIKEFDRIYSLLGIKIDYALGESFYQDKMQAIFEEMKQKGIVEQSQGAWVVKFANDELPTLPVIKSDGATTYFLRDLATIQYRLNTWQPQLIIYEVGADQSLHFRQLFKTAQMLGWNRVVFKHVAHGLMRSKTGKFSTRKGQTVHLEEVLEEAIAKAKEIIKQSETNQGLSETEKSQLAQQVGIGAIKYNDLSQHHSKDIIFDWGKLLNLKGNSGPYLQYTYARCRSVLQKSGVKNDAFRAFNENLTKQPLPLNNEELNLLRQLVYFPELLQKAAAAFSPNLIANYVFALAQEFNLFYAKHYILQADTKEQKEFRLALTFAVGQIIKNGLTLLGIESPEKM